MEQSDGDVSWPDERSTGLQTQTPSGSFSEMDTCLAIGET